nr:MAG TPA: hypothetical protein [Bacteriophage sp.]
MIVYLNAACVLTFFVTFTTRQVRRALGYEEYLSWKYALISMAKDIIDVAFFAFSLVQLLNYMKGVA